MSHEASLNSPDYSETVLSLLIAASIVAEAQFSKVKDVLRGQDVQVFVTAVPARSDWQYDDRTRSVLSELAELSGGNSFFPNSISQLESTYSKIVTSLKFQYLLGYRSTNNATDGKWRKIKITAEFGPKDKVTKFDVRTRQGYYAQANTGATPSKD